MPRRSSILLLWFGLAGAACDDRVALGAWGSGGNGTGGTLPLAGADAGGASGAPDEAGAAGEPAAGGGGAGGPEPPSYTGCLTPGTPEPVNVDGEAVGITIPYSDYEWPVELESLEWDVTVESEHTRDGYFFAQQFELEGAYGLVGLQARGGYQALPGGPIVIANMVVFWISSSLEAELGDVPYPDARTALTVSMGAEWWTVHALYDWQACRAYRFRVAPHSEASSGDVWYGAWVTDVESGSETHIGRILVPSERGRLAPETSYWTNRIGYDPLLRCDDAEPAAVFFGTPTANNGTLLPTATVNRFAEPPLCPGARFSVFREGVRQETGLEP